MDEYDSIRGVTTENNNIVGDTAVHAQGRRQPSPPPPQQQQQQATPYLQRQPITSSWQRQTPDARTAASIASRNYCGRALRRSRITGYRYKRRIRQREKSLYSTSFDISDERVLYSLAFVIACVLCNGRWRLRNVVQTRDAELRLRSTNSRDDNRRKVMHSQPPIAQILSKKNNAYEIEMHTGWPKKVDRFV